MAREYNSGGGEDPFGRLPEKDVRVLRKIGRKWEEDPFVRGTEQYSPEELEEIFDVGGGGREYEHGEGI